MARPIILAMEEYEGTDPNDLDFSDFEPVMGGEADPVISDMDNTIDAIDAVETHTEIVDIIATEGVGNRPQIAAITLSALETRLFGNAVTVPRVGTESRTRIASEGKNIFARAWKAIVKFFKKLWGKITSLFSSDKKKKTKKKAKEVKSANMTLAKKAFTGIEDKDVEISIKIGNNGKSPEGKQSEPFKGYGDQGDYYNNQHKESNTSGSDDEESSSGPGTGLAPYKTTAVAKRKTTDAATTRQQSEYTAKLRKVMEAMCVDTSIFSGVGEMYGPMEISKEFKAVIATINSIKGDTKDAIDKIDNIIKMANNSLASYSKNPQYFKDIQGSKGANDAIDELKSKNSGSAKEYLDKLTKSLFSAPIPGFGLMVMGKSDSEYDIVKLQSEQVREHCAKNARWFKGQLEFIITSTDTIASEIDQIADLKEDMDKHASKIKEYSEQLEKFESTLGELDGAMKPFFDEVTTGYKAIIKYYRYLVMFADSLYSYSDSMHRYVSMLKD